MRAACAADVQKFCANIERAKGAMRTCLEAHANAAVGQLQGRQGRARRRQGQGQELIPQGPASKAGARPSRSRPSCVRYAALAVRKTAAVEQLAKE